MSLQARRIGETQAQYNRRVGTKIPRTVGRPQKVERVSVMPQDMKAKDIPNQKRARVERRPQRVERAKAFPEERGRPVTRIGNRTIYEADMRDAKANYQNLAEAQRRQLQVAEAKEVKRLPSRRITVEQQLKILQKQAEQLQNRKNVPPDMVKIVNAQIKHLKKIQEGAKPRPLQQALAPRTGKPPTPQQLKQMREQAKEFERKNRIAERYMRGEIGRRDLKGTFNRQEIRNIEKGSVYRKYMDGKITDRQLSRSRMFSPQEIRSIKRQLRLKRMSPEERKAFLERQRKERQRLDKMAEDRRTQPQRRRRRIRDAFRRMKEERRSRRGLRGRTLEKPTRGTAPVRYRTRRQQERATGVRVPRRGRSGLI